MQVLESHDIAPVWAGHPVGFCLLTAPPYQYVAYYDGDRRMTVATRLLDDSTWQRQVVPSASPHPPGYRDATTSTVLGWDSHNSVILALDRQGHIHLSGNMHVNALTYFRSRRPHDVTGLVQIRAMTGEREDRCTYPRFLHNQAGDLIFHYRHGSSGSGDEIYNVYQEGSQSWRRLLDRPLTDGQGLMNAYLHEPLLGPDGNFHLSWVWRNTPDCSTNHDLSYARSPDLVHWFTADGTPLQLPMTLQTPGVVVDPIPVQGGIINGSGKIGFDGRGRPILAYHKFDGEGTTQAYCARWEGQGWHIYQISDWGYRWYFSGGGSIYNEVALGRVEWVGHDRLALAFRHDHLGRGRWFLDEESLMPLSVDWNYTPYPTQLTLPQSDFPGMQVRWAEDRGETTGPRWLLRWETLGPNRDRPRSEPLPPPAALQLLRVAHEGS